LGAYESVRLANPRQASSACPAELVLKQPEIKHTKVFQVLARTFTNTHAHGCTAKSKGFIRRGVCKLYFYRRAQTLRNVFPSLFNTKNKQIRNTNRKNQFNAIMIALIKYLFYSFLPY